MSRDDRDRLRLVSEGGRWRLTGPGADGLRVIDEYLGYLADRNYSPKTLRAYGFDLVMFGRWLLGEGLGIEDVTTPVLLRFLAACRAARLPGRPGPNVVDLAGRRLDGYAATTVNRRLSVTWNLTAAETISLRYDHELRRCVGHGSADREMAGARSARTGGRLVAGVG